MKVIKVFIKPGGDPVVRLCVNGKEHVVTRGKWTEVPEDIMGALENVDPVYCPVVMIIKEEGKSGAKQKRTGGAKQKSSG